MKLGVSVAGNRGSVSPEFARRSKTRVRSGSSIARFVSVPSELHLPYSEQLLMTCGSPLTMR